MEKKKGGKTNYLAADWTQFTSFLPFVYASEVELMRTLQYNPWLLIRILCKLRACQKKKRIKIKHYG